MSTGGERWSLKATPLEILKKEPPFPLKSYWRCRQKVFGEFLNFI